MGVKGKKKPRARELDEQAREIDPRAEVVAQVDSAVRALELKYGPGRLLAACPDLELARKMRSQLAKYNDAVWTGTLEDVQVHGPAVVRGYQALERAFLGAGHLPLDWSQVVEAPLEDGSVLAVVADIAGYKPAPGDARAIIAIPAEVVAELWSEQERKTLSAMAQRFPGCAIETVRRKPLEDEIPF